MSDTPRLGRRPGDAEVTRQTILDAAQAEFGESGFDRATIRAIAQRAAVDPALVHHHFGSKASLFAEAHELPDIETVLEPIFTGPRREIGEHLTRFYLTFATGPASPARSLIRAAATNGDAARMMRSFVERTMLDAAERYLDVSQPRLRAALCVSHLIGVVVGRVIVEIPELTEPTIDELVGRVAPVIQHYLTDDWS